MEQMPRLIVQRKPSARRRVPPCGRLIEYRTPHSPFQKLVHSAMRKQRISGREVARRVTDEEGNPTNQSTLWIWLHSVNGYPHPKSFRATHLRTLAKAIAVPETKLKAAIDASRLVYSESEAPMPHEAFDSFGRFIEIIEHDRRPTLNRSYVLNLAKTLHAGAHVEPVPTPSIRRKSPRK